MIIIYNNIDQIILEEELQKERIELKKIEDAYVDKIILIYTTSFFEVFKKVEQNENNKILLFTNFPINRTYECYERSYNYLKDKFSYKDKEEKKLYSISSEILKELSRKSNIIRIHVITGAYRHVISDNEITSLTPDGKIKIIRKYEIFINSSREYIEHVVDYIKQNIELEFKP